MDRGAVLMSNYLEVYGTYDKYWKAKLPK